MIHSKLQKAMPTSPCLILSKGRPKNSFQLYGPSLGKTMEGLQVGRRNYSTYCGHTHHRVRYETKYSHFETGVSVTQRMNGRSRRGYQKPRRDFVTSIYGTKRRPFRSTIKWVNQDSRCALQIEITPRNIFVRRLVCPRGRRRTACTK